MNCVFCHAEMLWLKDVWCPDCKTHYHSEWDHHQDISYIEYYKFQNKPDPKHPNRIIHAVFFPKRPPIRAHDSFEIRLFHHNWMDSPTGTNWEVLAKLDYLPDNINPDNFTDKLKIYLPFL